jgi:hypothetical protein
VDSLKALDLERPIRVADIPQVRYEGPQGFDGTRTSCCSYPRAPMLGDPQVCRTAFFWRPAGWGTRASSGPAIINSNAGHAAAVQSALQLGGSMAPIKWPVADQSLPSPQAELKCGLLPRGLGELSKRTY